MDLPKGSMNVRELVMVNDVGAAAHTPEILFDATTITEILGAESLET